MLNSRLLKKAELKEPQLDKAGEIAHKHLSTFIKEFRDEVIAKTESGSKSYKLFTDAENKIYEAYKKLIDGIEIRKGEIKNENEQEQ